jgi:hypothetical protein
MLMSSRAAAAAAAAAAAGAVDDLAIMPLLRRGVRNIIACVATHTNPDGSMADFAKGETPHSYTSSLCLIANLWHCSSCRQH